jgi:hypothetical protein
MTVQVLHAVPYTYDPDENTQYRSVGLVETPDGLDLPGRLEYAFYATQNVDEAWSEQGHRSTSVGDRMWIDNELWQVFGIGWGRVDL